MIVLPVWQLVLGMILWAGGWLILGVLAGVALAVAEIEREPWSDPK